MKKKLIDCIVFSIAVTLFSACGGGGSGGNGVDDGDAGDGVSWVQYQTGSGSSVKALYKGPGSASRTSAQAGVLYPAIIYNHGKAVEKKGYEGAANSGYDIKDFVEAIAQAGYAGLAPIRWEGSNFDDGIEGGAIQYLKGRGDIDPARIYMIGFSRGGFMTVMSAITYSGDLKAIALMAPGFVGKDVWDAVEPDLDKTTAPVYVALGADEPDANISKYTTQLVSDLTALGKEVESKLDYPGDHNWFKEVRSEYWNNIIDFINRH
ncbi:hypothetical protein MNBD_NITROSPINAE04-1628 [hydrothermal vent metagenome]|uniref:Dienelactone hydrolase domain-containing protein n=1 Tax=hydrothermal vent metagenome TaxID=652676 RepID=A0A3B1CQV4_9ZZZZ